MTRGARRQWWMPAFFGTFIVASLLIHEISRAGGETPPIRRVRWAQNLQADSRILSADLSGANVKTMLAWPQVSDPTAIGLAVVDSKAYWVQNIGNDSRLLRSDLSGGSVEAVVVWPQVSDPTAIALDGLAEKVYWAENAGSDSRIRRADLSGANIETLVSWPSVRDPKAIALDIAEGKMYWAENVGSDSRILRADVSGANVETLVAWPEVADPTQIALDGLTSTMVWTQGMGDKSRIRRADRSGLNADTIVTWPAVSDPTAIAVDAMARTIYWTQNTGMDSRMVRASISGTNVATVMAWPETNDPIAIALDGPICGDGWLDLEEECDDGNIIAGDGCSTTCTVESATCSAPTVEAVGSRYLRVTPGAGDQPIAIQVIGDSTDPSVACVSLYAQAPQDDGMSRVTTLGPDAVYLSPAEWGTFFVYGDAVRPSSTYRVLSNCSATLSADVGVTTWMWGDTESDFDVSFRDIARVVDGFTGAFGAGVPPLLLEMADIAGGSGGVFCTPNRDINFIDIAAAVDAFTGAEYACAAPCP